MENIVCTPGLGSDVTEGRGGRERRGGGGGGGEAGPKNLEY